MAGRGAGKLVLLATFSGYKQSIVQQLTLKLSLTFPVVSKVLQNRNIRLNMYMLLP